MLTELELAYFKAFGNKQRIPLRPITLIFGANSSGKSSILHSILLAHHGVTVGEFDVTTPVLAGDAVDLGGFQRFVFTKDQSLKSCIGLSFENVALEPDDSSTYVREKITPASVKVVFEIESGNPREVGPYKYQVWLDGRAFVTLETGGFRSNVVYINADHPYFEERLARIRRRLHEDDLAVWQLKDVLNGLRESYHFTVHALVDGFSLDANFSYEDEGKSEKSEVCHASVMTAAAHIDPELEELFEGFGRGFDHSPHEYIWNENGSNEIPKHILESGRIQTVFALALKIENAIFREFRLRDVLQRIHSVMKGELEKTSYLGPLRTLPKRVLSTTNTAGADLRASGGPAWDELMNNRDVQQSVNEWLSADFLNTKYEFGTHIVPNTEALALFLRTVQSSMDERLEWARDAFRGGYLSEEDLAFDTDEFFNRTWDDFRHSLSSNEALSASSKELVLTDLRTNTRVSHRDVGIGISQVIPVLVSAFGSKNKLLAIEQPELHLHPSLQAELGDVFIRSALGEASNQIIIETHSEHLILRLMRRIRETSNGTGAHAVASARQKTYFS